jgi:HK97 family phage prohead protease
MTAQERRAAAQLRRQAAEQAGERGGDAAYRAYRQAAPGIGNARRVPMRTDVRAETVQRDGKTHVHTFGYFTRYGVGYPMWDQFGEYQESVCSGAGRETIASKPDVAFLVNHTGMTMARTVNGTLELEERDEGGWHDAYLNPKRNDVADLVVAMDDRNIDQMSFAFMIPEGGGWWSEDFTEFEIRAYNLDRGDVSAVNYGASPYTDITARTAEVLNDIGHLPVGALRAAEQQLIKRGLPRPLPSDSEVSAQQRIEVRERVEPVVIAKGNASRAVQRLNDRVSRAAARYVDLSLRNGTPAAELLNTKLPWYTITNVAGDDPGDGEEADTATVYVFDEIGGSFGVDAKTFAADLDEITAPKIAVRINSPGGSVFDAIAIHSALLHHPAKVRTYVDGLAASAASVIAMGADAYDEADDTGGVFMMPGAQMMIHDASMTDDGNAADKEAARVYLDRQSANIANMYAGRAGGDPAEWRALMLAETWAFASEAVEMGLADKVYERKQPVSATAAPEVAERMLRQYDLTQWHYRYAGRSAAPSPQRHRGAPIRVTRSTERDVRDEFADMVKTVSKAAPEASAAILNPPTEPRDRQEQPKGRSIALIEQRLKLDEA